MKFPPPGKKKSCLLPQQKKIGENSENGKFRVVKEKYVKERGKTIEFVSFEICLSLREAEKKGSSASGPTTKRGGGGGRKKNFFEALKTKQSSDDH